jgi:nucleolar protein 4
MGPSKDPLKRPRGSIQNEDSSRDEVTLKLSDDQDLPSSKRPRTDAKRSLFVRSLPPSASNESLTEFFSQHFPVKHATVVLDRTTKAPRGFGFVTLADPEDAIEAQKKLDKELWDGRRIRIEIAEPRHRDGDKPEGSNMSPSNERKQNRPPRSEPVRKSTKLIIRNLPWSIKTSDQLAALFRSFGKIMYADLPNKNGKLSGFGFVTIRGVPNSQKAMDSINGKVIDGRTLAVDWAVDKDMWEQQRDAQDEEEAGSNDDLSQSQNELNANEVTPCKDSQTALDTDLEDFMKNHMQNMEDEDMDENENIEDDDPSDLDHKEKKQFTQESKRETDNSSTVFVRNLPYSTTDEVLKSQFTRFGAVRYARVVMDRATDRPAGTGFVCFFNADDSLKCIKGSPQPKQDVKSIRKSILQDENADPNGQYTLDGRVLQVSQAVTKEEASKLAADGQIRQKAKDKRNLFLLSEGTIDSRSPLYSKLAPTEIKMREKSAAQRRKMVQDNPSLHVSLTRLAIRNIPRSVTSKQLKALAREACVKFAVDVREGQRQPLSKEETVRGAKESKEAEHRRKEKKQGIVRQAKVVFETKEGSKIPEESGAGKSRGYGFIEYSSHRWALMGLRWLNGYQLQNEQGKKQRLIVEFAIENAQVVARRNANEDKLRRSQAQSTTGGQNDTSERALIKNLTLSPKSTARYKGRSGTTTTPEVTRDGAGESGSREDLKQKLIARKRLMRKKKAAARGKA